MKQKTCGVFFLDNVIDHLNQGDSSVAMTKTIQFKLKLNKTVKKLQQG